MKVSELKENVRSIIRKKMNEANALVTTKTGTKPVDYKNTTELNKLKSDPNVSSIETTAGQKLKEMDGFSDKDISLGFMPTTNLSKMTREEMLAILKLPTNTPENKISDEDLRIGVKLYRDAYSKLNEKMYLDDDDVIIEDVEDIDTSDNEVTKYYDEIYEINANVAPGSRYQIEVINDNNFIILTQDNGQEIVVHPDDVQQLIDVILKKYNESN
jgi:hypothetical protein